MLAAGLRFNNEIKQRLLCAAALAVLKESFVEKRILNRRIQRTFYRGALPFR